MAAFASGLANVGSSVGKFLSNPAVQKGIGVARQVTAPFMQQPLSPAQATAQPVATAGASPSPLNGVRQPGQSLADKLRSMYANRQATSLGKSSPDIASGIGAGVPARGSL